VNVLNCRRSDNRRVGVPRSGILLPPRAVFRLHAGSGDVALKKSAPAAKQQPGGLSVCTYMEPDDPAGSAALRWLDPAVDASAGSGAEAAVGALYRAQAVALLRLAYLMLGDRAAAEDVTGLPRSSRLKAAVR
jgi:hypothetical protein